MWPGLLFEFLAVAITPPVSSLGAYGFLPVLSRLSVLSRANRSTFPCHPYRFPPHRTQLGQLFRPVRVSFLCVVRPTITLRLFCSPPHFHPAHIVFPRRCAPFARRFCSYVALRVVRCKLGVPPVHRLSRSVSSSALCVHLSFSFWSGPSALDKHLCSFFLFARQTVILGFPIVLCMYASVYL